MRPGATMIALKAISPTMTGGKPNTGVWPSASQFTTSEPMNNGPQKIAAPSLSTLR